MNKSRRRNKRMAAITMLGIFGASSLMNYFSLDKIYPARDISTIESRIEKEFEYHDYKINYSKYYDYKEDTLDENHLKFYLREGTELTTELIKEVLPFRVIDPKNVKKITNEKIRPYTSTDNMEPYMKAIYDTDTIDDAIKFVNNIELKSDDHIFTDDSIIKDYFKSFKNVYKDMSDDCEGIVFSYAALLSDNGFNPYFMVLYGEEKSHMVYLYNDKGKFGTLGSNSGDNVRGFKSIDSLYNYFTKEYDYLDSYFILESKTDEYIHGNSNLRDLYNLAIEIEKYSLDYVLDRGILSPMSINEIYNANK